MDHQDQQRIKENESKKKKEARYWHASNWVAITQFPKRQIFTQSTISQAPDPHLLINQTYITQRQPPPPGSTIHIPIATAAERPSYRRRRSVTDYLLGPVFWVYAQTGLS